MLNKKLTNRSLTFTLGRNKKEIIDCDIEIEDSSRWNKIKITSKDPKIVDFDDKESINIYFCTTDSKGEVISSTEIINAYARGISVGIGYESTYAINLFPQEVNERVKSFTTQQENVPRINYYINKSPMLAPFTRIYPDEHGEVKQVKGKRLTFKLKNKKNITSDVLYNFESRDGHFESDRYQILTAKIRSSKNIINNINKKISPGIDNILLLMSFVHNGKVSYSSWRAEVPGELIWHYRSDKIQAKDIKGSFMDELIARSDVEGFIASSLSVYETSDYKDAIDNSIHSLDSRNGTVVELAYLTYFQALESIILTCKRIKGDEFILSEVEFAKLRKLIEKTVSDSFPNEKEKRAKIKSKISELNRVSLKESAEIFFSEFDVIQDDIWPIFDNRQKKLVGLSTIRNRIIHGDTIPSKYLTNIMVASVHLRTLLSRCIFSLLGWDVSLTKVDSTHLQNHNNSFNPEYIEKCINELSEFLLNNR